MKNWNWTLHHVPYVLMGAVSLYLISEPGRHNSAPLLVYLLFLPLPLYLAFYWVRPQRGKNAKE